MDEELTTSQLDPAEPISAEPDYSEPDYAPPEPEPDYEPTTEPNYSNIGADEPEVTLDDNGEVKFREDFFDNVNDEPMPPEYYTRDELLNTPYENWDVERLNGDVREFIPIVREQLQRRAIMQQLSQRPTTPPFMQEVQPYTPQQLAEEAQKLAIEKLGLEDPDDFDEYEGSHRAAFDMASQELLQRRNAEVQNYQRGTTEFQQLQKFNAELALQPDFRDFDAWFTGKLQVRGITPQQVNAGLMEYARRSGGNFGVIQGVISNWYREYQAERNGTRTSSPTRQPANRPPILESTRGGTSYDTRRGVNLRSLGEMDPDAQAQALMNMGLV